MRSDPAIYAKLPELEFTEDLIEKLQSLKNIEHLVDVDVLETITYNQMQFPIYSISMGSKDPTSPCFLIVGGVHGLERIGSKVVNSALGTYTELLLWDQTFIKSLENSRIIFVPILNPVGMYHGFRSNGNHVDLMRNSPVFSEEQTPFLYGGHRISPKLPFYRGDISEGMEAESEALWGLIQKKILPAKICISLDVHSGFGSKDRVWFPYAKTKEPFPQLAEVFALKKVLDSSYPNHVYEVEPQSLQYTTHGDLWDYFYDEYIGQKTSGFYLPLTLEMGSWMWIRKNPMQILAPLGIFNPIRPHRRKRILRRHQSLIQFLHRAVLSPEAWLSGNKDLQLLNSNEAMKLWFESKEAA